MKPLLISSGEPSGIGPDLCLALSNHPVPLVVVGDKSMLEERARLLGLSMVFHDYDPNVSLSIRPNHLTILSIPCAADVHAGVLNPLNSPYVIEVLTRSTQLCLHGEFSAFITAPVHKAVINQAGFQFSGHTEFLADLCNVEQVVMMLASAKMKVALVTTHLPLRAVADAISQTQIMDVIRKLHLALQQLFGILQPKIYVAGLNPHAGENGYLGTEEIDIIRPALLALRNQNIDVHGPFSADTMFSPDNLAACDAFVAMYHDQGLTVLKYASFGHAVNITLGLPFIRTSVDHGTALELAGTGRAETESLKAAVAMAAEIVTRQSHPK